MKALLLLLPFVLAGCADPHQPMAEDFGNSVRANIAAQVVNPSPRLTSDTPTTDGWRIENALRRYHTNTVYPPRPESGAALTGSSMGAAAASAPPY